MCSWLYKVLSVLLPRLYNKTDGVAHGQIRSKKGTLRPTALASLPTVLTGQTSIAGPIPEEPFN